MSTIATIQSSDVISASRSDINTNFSNLNTDKQEKGSGVTGNIPTFGASNVLIDSGKVVPSGVIVGTTDSQALTNKSVNGVTLAGSGTLTNSGSTSVSGANTGDQTISDATVTFTDITTNNVSTSKHGFVPKAPNDTTKFLRGDATWAALAAITFKIGATSYDVSTASGTQTIAHGLGVTPKFVRIVAAVPGAAGGMKQSITIYNGTIQSSLSIYGGSNVTLAQDRTAFILGDTGNGGNTNFTTGAITVDATNISIAWTKTSSPTGSYNLLWEAYG